ncbi:MAG: sigma-E factor negative regulatory protein [Chromatiaceae bacterium]|jgi:sigma-E factor negative regulatory protein RseA|nr:sigma-E factor negative regulatory protein [Chromatiaceae bacterium]
MSEQQRQHLSAFVDGEIDPELVHTTLSALESSTELAAAWERFHLIGSAIRSEPMSEEYRRIVTLVTERIAEEPVPFVRAAKRRQRTPLVGRFTGAALAAAAAFLAVFALPQMFNPGSEVQVSPNRQVAASAPEKFMISRPTRRWHLDKPALESKLDRFLVNHQELSPVSGMKGFLPYATVVGYETR